MAEIRTIEELKSELAMIELENAYVVASFVDNYLVEKWIDTEKEKILNNVSKILELRVFNKEKELKYMRTDISKNFYFRCSEEWTRDTFEEVQLLDVSLKTVKNLMKILPEEGYPAVRICYHLGKYETTGQARVEDWRIVGFERVN